MDEGDGQPVLAQICDGLADPRVTKGLGNSLPLEVELFGAHAGGTVQGQNQLQGHRLALLRQGETKAPHEASGRKEAPPGA